MKDRRTGGQSKGQSRQTRETATPITADETADDAAQEALSVELRERIAGRAYDLAERRGWQNGSEVEDWLEAERQILAESGRADDRDA
ncbi:MAG: DUF2934 domain-containing protein [Vicinamibacterales bacterium]